jgi:signal transduction histidine kinase
VTAARNAEERLHQAQAELAYIARVTSLGALSASIAHEVNQPLAAIITNGDACLRWLGRGAAGIGEATAAITNIISDGKRATQIVQRVRALSKKAEFEKSELDLNGVIQEVIPLVQREIAGHRASLQLDLASDLVPLLGDRVQLQQVILNLILNGIQAMGAVADRPRILVVRSTQSDPDRVLVAVQDSGIGFKLDDAERIFGAFYTTKPDGMGMGLSICRSIIEAHGGLIWAKPNPDGPGATFSFSLPAGHGAS